MPSAFAHAISAIAIGKVTGPSQMGWKLWLLGVFSSAMPDLDVIGFHYGIAYRDMLGHRGLTHSFFFAFLWTSLLLLLFYRNNKQVWRIGLFLFLCTASHGILDAMTSGGLGIAFFAPFENTRYFFPIRPIQVSPISIEAFFSKWGWMVMKSEFLWIWIPSLLTIFIFSVKNSFKNKK